MNPTNTNQSADYMWSSQAAGVGKYAKYAEQRINESPNKEELNKQKKLNFVQIEPRAKNRKKEARRVYDAPSKGILWGWEVAAYIFTKAIAAGAFLLPVAGGYFMEMPLLVKQIGAIISLIFLTITGILLIMDLGRPDRFLYVLFRPQWKSWLSRGSYIITIYGGLLTFWLAASFLGFENLLPYLEPFGIIFALLSAVYTAFLFAQAKGRDFWQSPMLGLHMIIHSLMAGFAVYLLVNLFLNVNAGFTMVLVFLSMATIVFHLITVAIELTTTHSTEDAHKTVEMITKGQFSWAFWWGMIAVGNILPLVLLFTGNILLFAIAGVLILIGLGVAQHIWVKAPQLIPLS